MQTSTGESAQSDDGCERESTVCAVPGRAAVYVLARPWDSLICVYTHFSSAAAATFKRAQHSPKLCIHDTNARTSRLYKRFFTATTCQTMVDVRSVSPVLASGTHFLSISGNQHQ